MTAESLLANTLSVPAVDDIVARLSITSIQQCYPYFLWWVISDTCLLVSELSTIMARGEGEIGGEYFGEFKGGQCKLLKVHRGGRKNLLGYSTSRMCINIMTQLHNGGFTHST